MSAWLRDLDELLRGRRTAPTELLEGRVGVSAGRLVAMAVVLGAAYGFFMGWFAIVNRPVGEYRQLLACVVKLPALFLLTLLITFPSLYVFNALVGFRLTCAATLRLLVGAIVVNLAVAASFGPILGFFTLSTTSYPFMVLLNVVLLGIAGAVGLGFLLHVLRRAATHHAERPSEEIGGGEREGERVTVSAAREPIGSARLIFHVWILLYGVVGAQMGWLLRPFVGDPSREFTWFRERSGSFFEAIANVIRALSTH